MYTYPYKTIGNILPKIKDSVDDIYKRGAIYKIPCKDCSNVYVGETGRCFNTRLSEHKRDLKPINPYIDYDKRKFLESLYINNTKNSINDKDRNVFPKIYSNIKKISTNVGFQPVKFVSFALSNYEIVMYVRFSPCVCWFVFLTSWFLNTVRVVFCFYLMKSARCNGRNVVEFFFNKYYAFCIC